MLHLRALDKINLKHGKLDNWIRWAGVMVCGSAGFPGLVPLAWNFQHHDSGGRLSPVRSGLSAPGTCSPGLPSVTRIQPLQHVMNWQAGFSDPFLDLIIAKSFQIELPGKSLRKNLFLLHRSVCQAKLSGGVNLPEYAVNIAGIRKNL